jgi:hypothetical protein
MVARGLALLLLFNVEGGRYLAEQIPGAPDQGVLADGHAAAEGGPSR